MEYGAIIYTNCITMIIISVLIGSIGGFYIGNTLLHQSQAVNSHTHSHNDNSKEIELESRSTVNVLESTVNVSESTVNVNNVTEVFKQYQ